MDTELIIGLLLGLIGLAGAFFSGALLGDLHARKCHKEHCELCERIRLWL